MFLSFTARAALIAIAAFPAAQTALAQPADMILRNGRIHTVDKASSVVQALAIRGGRFIAVGGDADAMKTAGPSTEVIDLQGKTVVPGLIDTHLHMMMHALNAPAVQLLGARSIADVQKAIADRVKQTPAGQWIIASSGWHESLLAEGRLPTRYEMDAVAPDHPVFIPRGGHVVSVNSRALALANVTKDTKNPPGGIVVRDPANGEATGVLLETAAFFARRVVPPPPAPDAMTGLMKAAMADLNSYGITGVIEPGIDERSIGIYQKLRDDGAMTLRADLLYRAMSPEQVRKGLAFAAMRNDNMLRFAGIKFPLDGGVEGARLADPYLIVPGEQPDADYRGVLLLPPGGEDEFVESLKLVADAGLQAQTHAVGDETIDVVVRAYERVNAMRPIRDLRWTVMHIFLPRDAAIAKMRDIGIMATAQDHSVLLGHNERRWWGQERAAYAIPIRKLLDAGLLVGGGTDGPVVPVDPFMSMWWMTTRMTLNGYALGPEQAITAKEALALYTINNAAILGRERELGSIETGKLADAAVLSQDILAVPLAAIKDTKALMTVVGGKIVFRAGL